ncbi:MAG: DUF2442 domain-containing protein [Firmicutes bacterium]|nr:DUF2442 domain-containing protein [Bacillota bacterium]
MYGDGVESVLHEVRSAYPVAPHHLILEFETGEYRVIDMRPFMEGPVFEPLKDPAFFRQVRADPDARTVVWPNGADVCPDVLYARSVPLELPDGREADAACEGPREGGRPGATAEGPEDRVEAVVKDFLRDIEDCIRDFRDSVKAELRRFKRDFLLALAFQTATLLLMVWLIR